MILEKKYLNSICEDLKCYYAQYDDYELLGGYVSVIFQPTLFLWAGQGVTFAGILYFCAEVL